MGLHKQHLTTLQNLMDRKVQTFTMDSGISLFKMVKQKSSSAGIYPVILSPKWEHQPLLYYDTFFHRVT